jgi:hypothetical protein
VDINKVLDVYREQFAFEIERKKEITSQVQGRIVLMVTASTLLVYMLRTVDLMVHGYVLIPFFVLSSLTIFLFTWVLYKLLRPFWGNQYSYLPSMQESEVYRQSLIIEKDEADTFQNYLIEEYSVCAGENSKTNIKRQENLNKVVPFLKISLIPFSLTGLLFLAMDLDTSSPRNAVKIEFADSISNKLNCTTISGKEHD